MKAILQGGRCHGRLVPISSPDLPKWLDCLVPRIMFDSRVGWKESPSDSLALRYYRTREKTPDGLPVYRLGPRPH